MMKNTISTIFSSYAILAMLLLSVFGLLASPIAAIGGAGSQHQWTSNFNAPAAGPHTDITIATNKKGNTVASVAYSSDGGTTWNDVTPIHLVKNGTPTKVTVPPEVIPHGAKVRVTGGNSHSASDPTPSGSIN